MVDIVISVAAKVAEYMVDPIRRHLSYLFKHRHHVEDLIQQTDKLDFVRERLGKLVEEAHNQGDEIYPQVKEWLQDTEGIIQKKEGFVEDQKQASKSCFYLKSRYHLSKQAEKQGVDIELKLQQARDFGDSVSHRRPPPLISSASSQNCEAFPSRHSIFDHIMEALRNEETSMVGVWGMGGVGKTTLALEVAKRAEEEKLFHKVVMASSISQTPNISEIQRDIARTLGLTFSEGEDRAVRLKNSLKNQQTILVILDDIWDEVDLGKIGIPCGDDHKGCKLLLTSRDRRVLDSDMKAQQVFHLPHLNAEEAWNLFKRTAGNSVESPEIRPIADEIVKHCEGLPIAIVTIANALKKNSAPEWKNALEELKKAAPTNLRGVSKKVYSCLELSYNHLDGGEAKSLFLLCGLLEEAHISMDRLLLYCMGLNLFEGLYSWEKATNKVITLVEGLKASSLLLDPDQDGEKDGYGRLFFDGAFVKMHDVVRDVARSIASKDECQYVVREVAELREWETRTDGCRISYSRISLQCGDMDGLPQRLVCPDLELFLLNSRFNGEEDMKIPDDFFQGLTKLRVVHLSGVSLGPSLGLLSNLRTLCLNECELQDMAMVGELKSLQVLSLAKSNIEELPQEMKQLRDLRVLDLRYCFDLRIIPRDVISSLSRLEYLSLKRCSRIEWERDGVKSSGDGNINASLSEIKHLPQLKTLALHVTDPILLPEDELFFHNVNLTRHWIVIGGTSVYEEKRGVSRYLEVQGNAGAALKCLSKLFRSCQDLSLVELADDIKEVVYELDRDHGFVELKHLSIWRSPAIEYVLGSRRDPQWVPPYNTWCMLEQLDLRGLRSMEAVCHGPIPVGCLRNLTTLILWGCKRLKYVLASSQYPTMELAFPRLQSLNLEDLPELISFSSSSTPTAGSQDTIPIFNPQVSFPALESLTVRTLINTRVLWEKQLVAVDSFSKVLKYLTVSGCHKLQNALPLCVAKALVQLDSLSIYGCNDLKTIVGDEEEDESAAIPPLSLFPKVTNLSLSVLSQLKTFCSSRRSTLRWPTLKRLEVNKCSEVDVLFQGLIGAKDDDQLDITIQQPLFLVQKMSFPALESLIVSGLINTRALWEKQLPTYSFSKVKKIDIIGCHKSQNGFPLCVVKALVQLEDLEIRDCDGLETIVGSEDENGEEDESAAISSLILFPKVTFLSLMRLPNLKTFCSYRRFTFRWPTLNYLRVYQCNKVEGLFGGIDAKDDQLNITIQQPLFLVPKDAFPALESLSISGLSSLRALWYNTQNSADFFSRLKELGVSLCGKLLNIFPLSVAKALGQLELLQIVSCEAVEEIVTSHEDEIEASLSLFPNLTTLKLRRLHQLKKFCSKRFALRWPRLKSLKLDGCCKVEILFVQETSVEGGGLATTEIQQPFFFLQKEAFPNLEELEIIYLKEAIEIWRGQFSEVSFSKLRNLKIQECHCISVVIPVNVVQGLQNLVSLNMKGCRSLNEVIQVVDGEQPPANDEIDFPTLQSLRLEDLPNLKSFCSAKCTFQFPSLECVVIEKCPKMEFLCKGDLHTPRLKHEEIGHHLKQYWETDLNTTIRLIKQAHL